MSEEAFSKSLFVDLEISNEIKRAVADMGFEHMTPIQEQAVPALLTGRDVIGQAQTGTGKTAAFGLPVLQMVDPRNKKLQAVILCPTRELAVQATNELRNFAKYMHDVKVLSVYGGQDISIQIRGLKGVQIIVGTPGRVMDHMRRHTIKMDDVKMVVLDEADEMLNMGFREDMEVILGAIEHEHQTCLFSATMPDEILKITGRFQNDPLYIKITKKELTIDRINQYYYPIKQEFKTLALVRLLKYYDYKRSIIFSNTKSMVDELAAYLQNAGYAAAGLHGDLTQKQRDSVMGRFRNGSLSILIATDIAARGIDVDNVEAVFNYDIPMETEYYVHRIGRTGRSGKEGASHTLCRSKDFRRLRDIENICHTTMEERKIPSNAEIKKIREMEVLKAVMSTISEQGDDFAENNGKLIKMVKDFCLANEIELEVFAAACLKKELGSIILDETGEEPEINLASKLERNRRSRNAGRGAGEHREERYRRFGGKAADDKNARRGSRRSDTDTANEGKSAGRGMKEKNREQSRRELKKAVRDVRQDGTSYRGRRRKMLDK